MATLSTLFSACSQEPQALMEHTRESLNLWDNWLAPINTTLPAGEDISYDDDFQMIREEVNKLSGFNTELICTLAEKLLIHGSKDIRVAAFYVWARLQQEGESGLAQGLTLLAALLGRYNDQVHPCRERPRKAALEWLAGSKVLDTLSLYPEVNTRDFKQVVGALAIISQITDRWAADAQPELGALYGALENRMTQSGGVDAIVPQTSSSGEEPAKHHASAFSPSSSVIHSGRELIDQAKLLAKYLRDQPDGWLAGHRLMKSIRWDTLHQLPGLDAGSSTRLMPPKAEFRAQLKRLYLQQSWVELIEQADRMFAQSVNHLWLDLQWYLHQALQKAGTPWEGWADIVRNDLRCFLNRMPGLEGLAYSDGTAFADEVTLLWINQHVLDNVDGWGHETENASASAQDDILLLEPEAVAIADKEGIDAALGWLHTRPGGDTSRNRWLLRLLMARLAEQYGKNELATHLLTELDISSGSLTLTDWEPELLFEVKARSLRLLRMKANRSDSDKQRLTPAMDDLLSGLILLDPVRAAVLCG
ncbi:type VI secretion system protein TssA [Scandinavium goeteborgense]|uniref:Type VI secretion system protein VasJ n=1 Tax=Scandinavium goeteborgense TaxID=1851514 RepID=A0A4R6DRJ1_SCAGO|nr:type VI secretion system protein TssA [Scandinavium goeteborgense]TDN47174.1 type VI secretion system protein VasJ [Scandinavium goeteborgense]